MKGERLTWILMGLVVLTAVSAIFPRQSPRLPGVIHFGVLAGAGSARTERALKPLASYLGMHVRRAIVPVVASSTSLRGNAGGYDLALVPSTFVSSWGAKSEVLAWAKHWGPSGARSQPYALHLRERPWHERARPRVILGDSLTWSGGVGSEDYLRSHGFDPAAAGDRVAHGVNPYDHEQAIAALVHGAFDLAVVRDTDLRGAVETGLVDRSRFAFGPAGPAEGGFVLVAGPTLSDSARRRVREAVLNLDLYQYDEANHRVRSILAALRPLGLAGFAPDEVLPSLRP
jgi:ABC-type phosphate/phosphonate transport system substrate-binding protein